jgi:hypothetical protein
MTGAHRVNVTAGHPQWRVVTPRHIGKISAKSAAHVLSAAVMWLIVLAIITVVVSAPADQNYGPADLYGVQRGLAH